MVSPPLISRFQPVKFRLSFLILLPVAGVIAWYLIKVFQFQSNNEEFSDGILALQLSRGWLEGRPVLYDNLYGDHARQHNYYFILLTGFLTKFTGIYGLFITYLGLVALLMWQWYKGFLLFGRSIWTGPWLTVFFFVFGPMAYYIYLDYFGWHPEHYFIPLLALLSLSLARRQFKLAVLWLLLTFLVKETSNILICSLLLFCSVTDLILRNPDRPWHHYIFHRRNFLIAGLCFVLFCLSMWWLSHLNGPGPSRLGLALSRIQQTATPSKLIAYTSLYCVVGLMTFGIGLLPFISWLRVSPRAGLIVWTLAGCYMLLFVIYFVETLFYFPTIYLSVSYPPRMGGLWAILLSAFIFLCVRLTQAGKLAGPQVVSWILTGGILQFLFSPFLVAHHFAIDTDSHEVSINAAYMIKTRLGLYPYPEGIPRQLHTLSKQLPEGSDVIVPNRYLSYFENVYPGSWNYDGGALRVLRKPLLYVYEKKLIGKVAYYRFPKTGYTVIPNHELLILADSTWYSLHFK
jgi:hypothetical protein